MRLIGINISILSHRGASMNGIPSALTLTVDADNQMTLNWDSTGNNHRVYYSTDNQTFSLLSAVTGKSYVATGLTPYTDYYFYVVCLNGAVESIPTNTKYGKTLHPSEINSVNTVGWYKTDILSEITYDGSKRISQLNDLSDAGHDLTQSEDAKKFLLSLLRNKSYGLYTLAAGITYRLNVSFTYNQPEMMYMIIKQMSTPTGWIRYKRLMDGSALNNSLVLQDTASPEIAFYAGNAGTYPVKTDKLTLDTWHILRILFNGAGSSIQVDAEAKVTGNVGTNNAGGICIGAIDAGTAVMAYYEGIYRNTAPGSSEETKIYNYLVNRKAELLLTDTMRQNYVNLGFGCDLCWGAYTYDINYPNVGDWDLSKFAPTSFPAIDDWMELFYNAGMKYVIIEANDHTGFAYYPTTWADPGYQPFSIAQTAWYSANGNPDLFKLMVDSAKAHGLKPIPYYSVWNLTHETRTGTTEVSDPTSYINLIKHQLTEILENYGHFDAIWFDGWAWHIPYANIPYLTIANHIKTHQHNILIISNDHIATESQQPSDLFVWEAGPPDVGNTKLGEEIISIRNDGHWWWIPTDDQSEASLKSASDIQTAITTANGRNASYCLAITPDRAGVIPTAQQTILSAL